MDNQLKRQIGNSMSVNVLEEIFRQSNYYYKKTTFIFTIK